VTISQPTKFAITIFSLLILLSAAATAQLKVGSGNTATADPPVPHPHTTPCTVVLFKGFIFNNFNAQSFPYAPPAACPGPWGAVVLTADFSISAGIQYDRTANIWLGPTNIYFGTTAEDQPNEGRSWHIERDLTDYSAILTTAQQGTVDLGNLVNQTYTGVIHGSASLLFYPPAPQHTAPRVPDQVIGFSAGPTGGTVGLGSTSSLPISLLFSLTFSRKASPGTSSGTPAFPTTLPVNSKAAAEPPSVSQKSPSTAIPPELLPSIPGSTPAASIPSSGSPSLASRH